MELSLAGKGTATLTRTGFDSGQYSTTPRASARLSADAGPARKLVISEQTAS